MDYTIVLLYVIQRILYAIPTLLILCAITFFLMHAVPGGPFDSERHMVPEIQAALTQKYHLDQPVYKQFAHYMWGLMHGDLGPSFKYKDWTVNQLIAQGLPVSATIGGLAMVFALIIGTLLGSLAALYQNKSADYAVMGIAMVGISIPNFVVAPILVLIFAITLHWLPASEWAMGSLRHLILPVTALSLPQIAIIARIMRASMIEVLHKPYIRTARAKGLPHRIIMFRHALRAALLPVISYTGPASAAILTGSVVVESIFNLPGVGRHFVQGALNRDYTLVMAVVILAGTLVVVFNLMADILYALLDPRIRFHSVRQ